MKNVTKTWTILLLSIMFTFTVCQTNTEDVVPNNNNDDDPQLVDDNDDNQPTDQNDIDVNKLTKSLKFDNFDIITGTIPTTASLAEIKIDTDTIFWVKGIKKRIRIKKPAGIALGALHLQIPGSDSYIETQFEENEESDSIAVFYFDFDPTDWELPLSFELNIVPEDENGTPVDVINEPVVIEEQNDGSCDFQPENSVWEWIYTSMNGNFQLAPMYPQTVTGSVSGCCDSDGNSFYADCINTPSHSAVDYESVFMVNLEYVKFFDGNDVGGELSQFTQNIRPSETDFCAKTPGYSVGTVHNAFTGKYSFNPANCTITISSLEGETEPIIASDGTHLGDAPLPIYVGSGPMVEYKILSRHFMLESRNIEGAGLERLYEARSTAFEWFD